MIDYGIRTRRGRSGFWRYRHDLDGSEWELVLPLDHAAARHLHDHGILCAAGDPAASSFHPGIIHIGDALEARLILAKPATRIARGTCDRLELPGGEIPARLRDLWSSEPPAPKGA